MTKAGVLNFFGVARAFALALALTGLILILGSVAIGMLTPSVPMLSMVSMLAVPGAFGVFALVIGAVLALVCSLTRLLVARMKFASVPPA